jgi:predicted nucleic acid-binding protein
LSLVLIDASAWIDYLRSGQGEVAAALEQLLTENRAALCGLALAEVRQGLRPHEESDVLELFEVLPWLETTRADFERAGELLARLRRRGTTIPTIDGLMAAHCLERQIPLLENDRHFGEVEGLQLYPSS